MYARYVRTIYLKITLSVHPRGRLRPMAYGGDPSRASGIDAAIGAAAILAVAHPCAPGGLLNQGFGMSVEPQWEPSMAAPLADNVITVSEARAARRIAAHSATRLTSGP
jgi:hypothetical protein